MSSFEKVFKFIFLPTAALLVVSVFLFWHLHVRVVALTFHPRCLAWSCAPLGSTE